MGYNATGELQKQDIWPIVSKLETISKQLADILTELQESNKN